MRYFILAATLFVTGCASGISDDALRYSRQEAAPSGFANLYIYRLKAPPYIYKAEIYVDGQLAVKLPEAGYAVFPVSQGQHSIEIRSFDWPDVSALIKIEDSKDVYLKFTGDSNLSAGGGGYIMESIAQIYRQSQEQAESELVTCCGLVPLK